MDHKGRIYLEGQLIIVTIGSVFLSFGKLKVAIADKGWIKEVSSFDFLEMLSLGGKEFSKEMCAQLISTTPLEFLEVEKRITSPVFEVKV